MKQIRVKFSALLVMGFSVWCQSLSCMDTTEAQPGAKADAAEVKKSVDATDEIHSQDEKLHGRIWWEKAERAYEKIKQLTHKILAYHPTFIAKRNELAHVVKDTSRELGFSESSELTDLASFLLGQSYGEGQQDSQKQALITQLRQDATVITQAERGVEEGLAQLVEQLNLAQIYERQAWDYFKAINRELDDKKAHKLYQQMSSYLRSLNKINKYLSDDLMQYFDQIGQKITEVTVSLKLTVEALNQKDINVQAQASAMKEVADMASDGAGEELEELPLAEEDEAMDLGPDAQEDQASFVEEEPAIQEDIEEEEEMPAQTMMRPVVDYSYAQEPVTCQPCQPCQAEFEEEYSCGNPLNCGAFNVWVRAGVAPLSWRDRGNFSAASCNALAIPPLNQAIVTILSPLPQFNELFHLPWIAGFQLGYAVTDNFEFYGEFNYRSASARTFTAPNVPAPNEPSGISVVLAMQDNYHVFDAYVGGRYYWGRYWCDRFAFFVGAKFGLVHHSEVDFIYTLTSLQTCTGTASLPLTTTTPVPFFSKNTRPASGMNVGFDWCFNCGWSFMIMAEIVGSCGPKSNNNIAFAANVPCVTTLPSFSPTNLIVGGTGVELFFPVTFGLKYSF